MPNYQAYTTKKETPSRLTRKSLRSKTFLLNKSANRRLKAERAARRLERLESSPREG